MGKSKKTFGILKDVKELGLIEGVNCYILERKMNKYNRKKEVENKKLKEKQEIENMKRNYIQRQNEQIKSEEELIKQEKNMYRSR